MDQSGLLRTDTSLTTLKDPSRTCPLCGSGRHEEAYDAKDRHYGIPGRFRLVRCRECRLVFLHPMLSENQLSGLYPEDYYAYQDYFPQNSWKENLKRMVKYGVGTCDPKFSAPGRMLDVGCGSGWFLSAMHNRGWDTYGVEINKAAAELGRHQGGLNIFAGTITEARYPSEFFDYVRSNHSFEHISCPMETLREMNRVLRNGGKLLIGVPNIESLNARLFGQYWWYLGVPVHPFSYSVKTLSEFLRKTNFVVERVVYNSDYSGILGSFQIFLNRNSERKSGEGWAFNNRALRVVCNWIAKVIDLFREGDAIEITARKKDTVHGRA